MTQKLARVAIAVLLTSLGACTTPQALVGAGAATLLAGASPGNDLEQTYCPIRIQMS